MRLRARRPLSLDAVLKPPSTAPSYISKAAHLGEYATTIVKECKYTTFVSQPFVHVVGCTTTLHKLYDDFPTEANENVIIGNDGVIHRAQMGKVWTDTAGKNHRKTRKELDDKNLDLNLNRSPVF